MDGRSVEQLLAVEPARCSREQLFDQLIELDRLTARVQARRERFLAAIHDPGDRKQWAREEVACALRWSVGFTAARLAQAHHLVTKLPKVLALHETGAIGEAHARAAAEATYGLSDQAVAAVQDRVLARAPEQTVTQFRAGLRRAAAAVDTRTVDDTHQAARAGRLVRLSPLPDGMAGIWSTHTALDAAAIYARLSEAARHAEQAAGEHRIGDRIGMDARRADIVRDLLLGTTGDTPARHARVQVLIPHTVATGSADAPGELAGYGPIPATQCRDLLTDPTSRIEQLRLDPAGQVLPIGVIEIATRRDPTTSQARWITARYPTCRFPSCNRRAVGCEIDHTTAWNGHNTLNTNLGPLCARHHHLKHDAPGWTLRQDTSGTFTWHTPHGRTYRTPPDELPTADP